MTQALTPSPSPKGEGSLNTRPLNTPVSSSGGSLNTRPLTPALYLGKKLGVRACASLIALTLTLIALVFGFGVDRPIVNAAPQPTWTPSDVPTITPTSLQEFALPAPLCTLEAGRLICYHELHHATPIPISPTGQFVTDFAIAPDGDWVAYRTGSALMMASTVTPTGSGSPRVLDPQAVPSDLINAGGDTIAWSPDSLTLVYITAFGFRARDSHDTMIDVTDRPYIALRWSPDGSRLAAQTSEGGWVFFAFTAAPIQFQVTRTYAQASDMAWISTSAAVIAPRAGGLLQIDVTTANSAPVWTVAGEHFMTLHAGAPGQVLAMHVQPGATVGMAVGIDSSGKWMPFGQATLDLQMQWGPPLTDQMVYITSGTPILTDRATGDENMLPFQKVGRLQWSPGVLNEVSALPMDADLYFVAPDSMDVAQVWRLPRDGSPLLQLTYSTQSIIGYAVGVDSLEVFTADGGSAFVNQTGATPTPTGTLSLTPTATRSRLRSTATHATTITPTATPFASITPPPATAYSVRSVGWPIGPALYVRVAPNGTLSPPVLIGAPVLSPIGGFAYGIRGSQLTIINWTTGQLVALKAIHDPTLIRWVG